MTEYAFGESLKAVLAELDNIPKKIEINVVRGAMRAAAKPLLEAARREVPKRTGALLSSIRYSSGFSRRSGEMLAQVKVGGRITKAQRAKGMQDAYYAHMVEFGTKPHIIKGPIVLNGIKRWNVHHPGSGANGFMRRAFDASGQAVVDAYADYMRARIPKELAKHGGG